MELSGEHPDWLTTSPVTTGYMCVIYTRKCIFYKKKLCSKFVISSFYLLIVEYIGWIQ
jgi:hypothetical protein